jgi:hypothetical protein
MLCRSQDHAGPHRKLGRILALTEVRQALSPGQADQCAQPGEVPRRSDGEATTLACRRTLVPVINVGELEATQVLTLQTSRVRLSL